MSAFYGDGAELGWRTWKPQSITSSNAQKHPDGCAKLRVRAPYRFATKDWQNRVAMDDPDVRA